MHLRGLIKRNAGNALKNNWSKSIAISLIFIAVTLIFLLFEILVMGILDVSTFVDMPNTPDIFFDDIPNYSVISLAVIAFVALISFAVISPLAVGLTLWFYRIGGGGSEEVSTVFDFFSTGKSVFGSIILYFLINLQKIIILIIIMSPSIAIVFFSISWKDSAQSSMEVLIASGSILFGILLCIVSLMGVLIFCMRYFLAPFIYANNSDVGPFKAIRLSTKQTKGQLQNLFEFEFSFIGWHFISFLVVTQIYTIPYLQTARGLYARYLITNHERKLFEDSAYSYEASGQVF